MLQIGATQLVMGFLSLTESQVDRIQPFDGARLIKVGSSPLDATMTGATYMLSQEQAFYIIFDSDFRGEAVVQKTFWGTETDTIYNMLKRNAIPYKSYPGSNGFFIQSRQLGDLLVEKQQMAEGTCITVSRECVL